MKTTKRQVNRSLIVLMNCTKSWGGGEKWHLETAILLKQQSIPVLLVVAPGSELDKRGRQAGIDTFSLRIHNFSYLNIFKVQQFAGFLSSMNPRVLLFNSSADAKFGSVAGRLANIPKIIYRRGSAIPLKGHWINRLIFKNAITAVLANSEETKRTINQNANLIHPDKIKVIYNGIHFPDYNPDVSPVYVRNGTEFVIGHAGRFVYQKNQEDILRMAAILKSNGLIFKLLIAGSGKLEKQLKDLCEDLDLQNEVLFLGFQDDLSAFYRSLDVFVLSSRWEGFGFVLAEAAYFGVPSVAYRVSSNPELIQHEKSGLLADSQNPVDLAKLVMQLADNKEAASKMGCFAKERVQKLFDRDKNFKLMLDFLR